MKLGRVTLTASYVVDLDNAEQVEHAKSCLYEDISNWIKTDQLFDGIGTVENKNENLTENDIPEFLREDDE